MAEFRMPSLGSDMEAGTLVEWQIKPGDAVHRGQIVAVVETVKGAIDVEIFEDGVVDELLVVPGTEVPVGTALARIRSAQPRAVPESPEPSTSPAPIAATPAAAPSEPAAAGPAALAPARGGRLKVSPAARRRAAERGIDLADVRGSGPDGAITLADVEGAAAPAPRPAAGARDLAAMRQAIAAAMAHAKREIPHYYLAMPVDMAPALAWLELRNADRPPEDRLLPAILLVKAVAKATKRFAEFNGFYRNGGFEPSEAVHVGMAIALRGGGLVAPALHDARDQDLDALMQDFRDLVQRARSGHLRSSELADPTITVTSLGERGVEAVFPIIYPPQVAIVGFGAVTERPWVQDGRLIARQALTASLAADHRVSDGHRGGLFLAAIADALQQPELL
ncbi:MAG: dihydrolipoamide acetyltransferase family protein [Pseudomonadota bacterium]|nr:dihydrolipoamide acetyltransferase family protein [Pseudomonadota bacterium]